MTTPKFSIRGIAIAVALVAAALAGWIAFDRTRGRGSRLLVRSNQLSAIATRARAFEAQFKTHVPGAGWCLCCDRMPPRGGVDPALAREAAHEKVSRRFASIAAEAESMAILYRRAASRPWSGDPTLPTEAAFRSEALEWMETFRNNADSY